MTSLRCLTLIKEMLPQVAKVRFDESIFPFFPTIRIQFLIFTSWTMKADHKEEAPSPQPPKSRSIFLSLPIISYVGSPVNVMPYNCYSCLIIQRVIFPIPPIILTRSRHSSSELSRCPSRSLRPRFSSWSTLTTFHASEARAPWHLVQLVLKGSRSITGGAAFLNAPGRRLGVRTNGPLGRAG